MIDIREWVAQLADGGFTVLPQAESILENFGGLTIVPMKTPNDAYLAETIRFDPVNDILSEVDRIQFWQRHLGSKLTPLGMLYPSESMLLVAENGSIYAEWGNIISERGSSFKEALENTLIFARHRPVLQRVGSDGRLVRVE